MEICPGDIIGRTRIPPPVKPFPDDIGAPLNLAHCTYVVVNGTPLYLADSFRTSVSPVPGGKARDFRGTVGRIISPMDDIRQNYRGRSHGSHAVLCLAYKGFLPNPAEIRTGAATIPPSNPTTDLAERSASSGLYFLTTARPGARIAAIGKMEKKIERLPFQMGKMAQQQILEDGTPFPLVLIPQFSGIEPFLGAIRLHRDALADLLQLSGALLFRGFAVRNASDFNAVVEAFGWEEQPYPGAACRTRIVGRVHTANEAALHHTIHSHNEMGSYEEFPTKVFFFCEVAPPEGGQTAILQSRRIGRRLEAEYPEIASKLEKEGLVYARTLTREDNPNYHLLGWENYFGTKDRAEAEINAAKGGFEARWLEDGGMKVLRKYSAMRQFGEGQKKVWFSAVVIDDPVNPLTFGDGTPFPVEVIELCNKVAVEECVDVNWQVGDVLLLDNRFVQHARKPSKPPRKVLTALCK